MKKVLYRYFTLVIALAAFTLPAVAQNNPAAQNTDNFVTEKGFKNRIFDVRHREPGSLARVLRTLSSGAKGAEVSPNSEFRTITVRDFPENLTVMEDALKRLDTVLSPRPNIDLNIHVMLASRNEATTGEVPSSLNDVLSQLRETFNYKGFEMVTSVSQRLTETERGLNNGGTALIRRLTAPAGSSGTLMNYDYAIGGVSLASSPTSNAQTVQINEFKFSATVAGTQLGARMQTALNLRDGEKVVVGTAAFEDRALIVVLTAKLLK